MNRVERGTGYPPSHPLPPIRNSLRLLLARLRRPADRLEPSLSGLPGKLASLVGLHAVNNLLPLVTLPYLVRTLGLEAFGKVGLALAINQYLLLVSEYGFTLSTSRDVARDKTDHTRISELFWSVQFTKLLLVILALFVLLSLVHLIRPFQQQSDIIYVGFIIVIGHLVTPTWLFLGKEAMNRLLIFTIIPRVIAIPATFILINTPSDAWIAMAIQSLPILLTGLMALWYVFHQRWISVCRPHRTIMLHQFQQGWPLFVSSFSTSLYTSSTPIALGLLAGKTAVGAFVAADKIRVAGQSLITPVSQVMFPRLNALLRQDARLALHTMRRMIILQGGVHLVVAFLTLALSAQIINLAYAARGGEVQRVLSILAPAIWLVGLSTVLGTHIMLPIGMSRPFSRILALGGIWHLSVLLPLSKVWGAPGGAAAVTTTELAILIGMMVALSKASAMTAGLNSPGSVLTAVLSQRRF